MSDPGDQEREDDRNLGFTNFPASNADLDISTEHSRNTDSNLGACLDGIAQPDIEAVLEESNFGNY